MATGKSGLNVQMIEANPLQWNLGNECCLMRFRSFDIVWKFGLLWAGLKGSPTFFPQALNTAATFGVDTSEGSQFASF